MNEQKTKHFIEEFIEEDLQDLSRLITRFPPEPNGYLHIGHAKSIVLNFTLAQQYKGACNLRFDDTNPAKESSEYVESIKKDVSWLGYDYENRLFFASDYFEKFYECAINLIEKDLAFVCDLTQEELHSYRGTFTDAGKESPYRGRSVEENLTLFKEMRAGKYKDGEKTLRAKIDMSSPNINMRDPVMYRIAHIAHHNTGDEWCIYPMYDYAHPLEDAIEGVTHSLCSIEFENNRPLYNWFVNNLDFERKPRQIEFAKLKLTNTIMGKRHLRRLIEEGKVTGWDDPRLPTLLGLRRRGYTPEIIKNFCNMVGISKSDSTADIAMLEYCAREALKDTTPQVMAVLEPLKVIITNLDENETLTLRDKITGERTIIFSKEIYIEKEDFMEEPVGDFHRLSPGAEVRLKGAYFIKCNEIIKDKGGNITALHCTYDPETKSGSGFKGRKVKSTIHWVGQDSIKAKVNILGYLVDDEGDFNENSLITKNALLEKNISLEAKRFQFVRQGFFAVDSTEKDLCFNLIVNLKSSYKPLK